MSETIASSAPTSAATADANQRSHHAQRDLLIDVVRGMAIVLVALGHTAQGELHRNWWGASQAGNRLCLAIYAFHMPAFFFVSGVFLRRGVSRRGERGYVFEKLRTIVYPYVLWSCIFAAATILFARFMMQTTPDWKTFLFNLLTGSASWFLPTLFIALMVGMVFRNVPMPALFVLSVAVCMWAPRVGIMCVDRTEEHLVFLVTGMWAGRSFKRIEAISTPLSALAATLLALLVFWVTGSRFGYSIYLFIPLGLLGTLMLMLIARCLGSDAVARGLAWSGAASFGIFLMSSFPQGAAREFLARILHTTEPWLQLIFPTILAVLIPAWLYHHRKTLHLQWMFIWPF